MNLTLISSAIAAAIAFSAAWQLQSARLSDLRTEYATAQFQALEKAHAQTIELQAKADTAARNHAARATTLANAAALATSELDGLRGDLATLRGSGDSISTSDFTTLAGLFAECGQRYTSMAAEADKRSSEVILLLDAWPVQSKP
jgi:hypothetical protein